MMNERNIDPTTRLSKMRHYQDLNLELKLRRHA